MLKLTEKFLVNQKGRKTAVLLDIKAYRQLMERLENLEDALELDKAVREETTSRPYDEIRAELKRAGRL